MRDVRHQRIIQIMPADGWWAIYWQDDNGTITTYESRVTGFGLVEEWYSPSYEAQPPGKSNPPERIVYPLTYADGVIDIDEADNRLVLFHQDERFQYPPELLQRLALEASEAKQLAKQRAREKAVKEEAARPRTLSAGTGGG